MRCAVVTVACLFSVEEETACRTQCECGIDHNHSDHERRTNVSFDAFENMSHQRDRSLAIPAADRLRIVAKNDTITMMNVAVRVRITYSFMILDESFS